MRKEKMWVEYEEGAHLSRSVKKPGSFSPLTRDGVTNNLGHVTLDPIDGDETFQSAPRERSELQSILHDVAVQVAVTVTLRALETARPHVEKWVTETAVPAISSAVASAVPAVGSAVTSAGSAVGSTAGSAGSAVASAVASAGSAVGSAAVSAGSAVASASAAVGSAAVSAGSAVGSAAASAGSAVASAGSVVGSTVSSAWNKVTGKKGTPAAAVESHTAVEPAPADAAPVVEVGVVVEAPPVDASHDVAAAIEAYRAGMSQAEARQRIVAALAARLFSEQQIAIVRNARIEVDGDTPQLDGATLALAQKQIGESVQLMLETAPALLAEDALVDLKKILGPAPYEVNGQLEQRM
jgi:hypothetical protein